jgi:benzodiazapine receptor
VCALRRQLLVLPLAVYCLHLCIGDTWNTINNVENRLGTAVLGVAFVWASAVTVDALYLQVSTAAAAVLAPSVLWLTVASALVFSINQLNGNEPLLPMK